MWFMHYRLMIKACLEYEYFCSFVAFALFFAMSVFYYSLFVSVFVFFLSNVCHVESSEYRPGTKTRPGTNANVNQITNELNKHTEIVDK